MNSTARRHSGTAARMCVVAVSVPLCLGAALPRLWSQTSPPLLVAMQLAAEGRTDSARRLVAAVLARTRPGDSLYVEALYSRGRLGGSADTAERDLRRVAIEYSTSRWADDAMLQLAQLALVSGNATAALTQVQRLRADYPGSEVRAQAAYWGGRAAFDAGNQDVACALLDSARAEAAGDIEFQNQIAFYRSRCITVVSRTHPRAPPPDDPQAATAPVPAPAPAPPPVAVAPAVSTRAPVRPAPAVDTTRAAPPAGANAGYEVQVGASRDSVVARRVAERFNLGGLAARVVPGADGYFRVRLGPFATLQRARDASLSARRFMPANDRPFLVRP